MRYLYYCNSTYQLLTVINLHWHRKNAGFENIQDYKADLILLNAFNGAEDMAKILSTNNVFDNTVLVNRSFNKGFFHSFYTIMDAVFPMLYLKHHHGFSAKQIRNKYDVITVPKYTTIVGAIWRVNNKADLHLYEDGLGTYSLNNDLLIPHSRLYRIIYDKGLARKFTEFSKLYLNVPELYSGSDDVDIIKIPEFNNNYLEEVRNMFKDFSIYKNEDNKSIYWLAQTLENDETIRIVKDVLDSLLPYKDEVLYCPHPRWPEKEKQEFDMAPDKQIWELKLLNMKDLDNKLLISIHSTACLTPKMLYDKEPYLILFFKMIDDKVTERNEKFDKKVNAFINMYKDKSKVMLPATKEEFLDCVSDYLNTKE